MIEKIILVLSLIANGVLILVVGRLSRRLLEFDDIFQLFTHDIKTNIGYFEKLTTTPLFMNSPEITQALRSMKIIEARFKEFLKRMDEARNIEGKKG